MKAESSLEPEAKPRMAATDRQETTTSVQDHGFELDRRTQLCLAGKKPSTEQGLRVSGANLGDDDRPCLNPPYAKPDRPCVRLFKHPVSRDMPLTISLSKRFLSPDDRTD